MKKNIVLLLNFSMIICGLFLLQSCAQIESPNGGPRDKTPPKVVKSGPVNKSVLVDTTKKEISITFDEFVNLTSASEQIVISPIPEETPEYLIRSKSLLIKFTKPFNSNTTYSINFGEAIKDVNENNIFLNYNYLFSTAPLLDTLIIKGKLLDAFTLKPVKGAYVFLYANYNDTMAYKGNPLYKSKVNDNGDFIFNGLKKQSYKMIAISDLNQDNKYQSFSENIAFADKLIEPEIYLDEKDTTITTKNSITELYLFLEKDTVQKITNSKYQKEGCVLITLSLPAKKVVLEPLLNSYTSKSIIEEHNSTNDTIRLWTIATTIDTIKAKVIADLKILDTIIIGIPQKIVKKETKKKDTGGNQFNLLLANNEALYYYQSIQIQLNIPLDSIKLNQIQLQESKDTLYIPVNPEIIANQFTKRIQLKYKWNPLKNYKLFIPPNTMKDIAGNRNDTMKVKFTIKAAETFGIVILKFKTIESNKPYIIQLLTDKDDLVQEKSISNISSIKFENVVPSKYKLRIIYDSNANGKWDVGSLIKNIQPEKVLYNNDPITVKENWESEVEW